MTQSTPSHYDGLGTIDKQEYLVEMLIERGMDPSRAFDAATAIKYTDRVGRKDGESDEKDLGKAADYLFRAVYDVWPWEHAASYDNKEPSDVDRTDVYDVDGKIVCTIQEWGKNQ